MNPKIERFRKRALAELPRNPSQDQILELMAKEEILDPMVEAAIKNKKLGREAPKPWVTWVAYASLLTFIVALLITIIALIRQW